MGRTAASHAIVLIIVLSDVHFLRPPWSLETCLATAVPVSYGLDRTASLPFQPTAPPASSSPDSTITSENNNAGAEGQQSVTLGWRMKALWTSIAVIAMATMFFCVAAVCWRRSQRQQHLPPGFVPIKWNG